jgi:DNA-binding transcriptional regulator YiaG
MEYKTIPNHPRYEISKEGIIRTKISLKIKSQYVGSTGYYMVSFSYLNKSKPLRVHRLIAETYIPNPENQPEINHKDGNKLNNNISNLEWVTHLGNMQHANKAGLMNNKGSNNGTAKLKETDILKIRELLKTKLSQQKIANMFNVSRSAILMIHLNKRWSHV